jgi:hypothetical protein
MILILDFVGLEPEPTDVPCFIEEPLEWAMVGDFETRAMVAPAGSAAGDTAMARECKHESTAEGPL